MFYCHVRRRWGFADASFPFINQMLLEIGAAKTEEEVGYAAGIVRDCVDRADARSNRSLA